MDLIEQQILKLRQLTELDLQSNWLISTQNLEKPPQSLNENWLTTNVNDKNYLVWEKGQKIRWFAQEISIPETLNNYPLVGLSLRIKLTWWAELAEIFVNGNLVAEGDLFDSSTRILLTDNAKTGEKFLISLRLISPKHDIGGLMISCCLYENNYQDIDPSFIANELTILKKYVQNFHPEKKDFLVEQIKKIDWKNVTNQQNFNQSLTELRNNLLPLSNYIKQRQFYLLGHAHLDMAWLWEIEETYTVAQRTFNSVLNLQKEDKNLVFGHTTAYLYQWIENNNPELFKQIKTAVKKEKWEILGGMWVEAEVNLISGESLARQLLYGQQYFYDKFGVYNQVAWLPDSFGFPWQLPQFLNLAKIDYFVTGKLHWNDTTKFPHGCFWWQSPDGSRIFTAMSPPNVAGVMDTNPMTMVSYSVEWENQTGLQDIFWLPGVGDHGGGPTRDMLDVAKRYEKSPFFPKIKFSKASEYLTKIKNISADNLPVWNSELYLELHRGCYTTHGEQKFYNRYCEKLLYQAELFTTIAYLLNEKFNLNHDPNLIINSSIFLQIKDLWQKVLLNQFHDILPGTSITEVFTSANRLWQEIIKDGENILQQSLQAIASYLKLPKLPKENAQPIVIFNSLNWQRNGIVELDIDGNEYKIYSDDNKEIKTQVSYEQKLLFSVGKIPSVGYQLFWLVPTNKPEIQSHNFPQNFVLNNKFIQVKINPQTGNLISVYDIINSQEILNQEQEGNELQLFKDEGQYWDAWNINPDYEKYPLLSPKLTSIKWLENEELRQIIRVTKIFNQSEFTQEYILNFDSPILIIKNKVNWQEKHTLLKVNFPLQIKSDFVTYEIACGAIQRTTKPQTKAEKAQWEVSAHHWADLSNNEYGISLLNDCKYGYDAKENQLRLSLLRSPQWPDSESDQGFHQFTYGLYPHKNNWQKAKTVHHGYELNVPLQMVFIPENQSQLNCLPHQGELLNLGAKNLILMALKPSEKELSKFILRCYECYQENAKLKLNNILGLKVENRVNILENEIDKQNNYQITTSEIAVFQLSH